ncbi:hypothetical protein CsSME_00047663 [Camellia sinensis var. sinensis]
MGFLIAVVRMMTLLLHIKIDFQGGAELWGM